MDNVMEKAYDHHDKHVRVRVNYSRNQITVLEGPIQTRQDFLDLDREAVLLVLINQIIVERDRRHCCVEDFAYNICDALSKGDANEAYRLASEAFHRFDDFDICVQIK